LANEGVWEDSTGYNRLLHQTVVNVNASGEPYSGASYFQPISIHPVGIIKNTDKVPQDFKLEGNYPNPFNNSTIIQFSLYKTDFVKLEIFAVDGRLITRLINKRMTAGVHKANWHPTDVGSGIYFYKLTIGEVSQTGKAHYMK
jgi:hypothetical protein